MVSSTLISKKVRVYNGFHGFMLLAIQKHILFFIGIPKAAG